MFSDVAFDLGAILRLDLDSRSGRAGRGRNCRLSEGCSEAAADIRSNLFICVSLRPLCAADSNSCRTNGFLDSGSNGNAVKDSVRLRH
jgi:hypothetical protein